MRLIHPGFVDAVRTPEQDDAELAKHGLRIGEGIAFVKSPPPWWRPISRWLWHRRNPRLPGGVMRVTEIRKEKILLLSRDRVTE